MARSVGLVILLLELDLFSEVGADRYAGVCRVCMESMAGKHCIGTAFIVRGCDEKVKAITNAHVLEDEEDARDAELQCGYIGDRIVTLDPDSFFWTSPTSAADTTIVAVSGSPHVAPMTLSTAPPQQGRAIQIWGFGGGKDPGGPGGEVKSTEFHNHFYFIHDAVTEGGHSGSPIMMKENGAWIVVGLHRQGSEEGGFGGGTMTSELYGLPELNCVFAEPTSEVAPTPAPARPTAAPTPHPTVAPTLTPARPTAAPTPHPTAATSDDSANVTSDGSADGDKVESASDGGSGVPTWIWIALSQGPASVIFAYLVGPQEWNICSILIKVCLLGELYFTLQVGGTKATYVFLSWVQDQLKAQSFEFVLALTFVVGFTMFMLPFVPWVPVYIFCGMVVTTAWTERATGDAQTEFYKGCVISVGLGLCLKLTACCGQYLIGYSASRSIAVLKFVGADTKVTRAIGVAVGGGEKVSCFGKVLVLVGGPDWPTSVMCGILKVNVPSMLCHTIPVVTVISPCVLTGAYLASVTCSGQGSAAANASICSLLAAVGQLVSMLGAMIYLQMIYTTDFPHVPTEEEPIYQDYAVVVALRRSQYEMEEAYAEELMNTKFFDGWRPTMGLVIAIAALFTVFSNGIFSTDLAFENFSVSSKISDKLDQCGLGGDVMNIVKIPGLVALVLFAVSVVLHMIFVMKKSRDAANRQKATEAAKETPRSAWSAHEARSLLR